MTKKLAALKAELLAVPATKQAYDKLVPEYTIARIVIRARTAAGMSQQQLAHKMGTAQSYVAKLEGGQTLPSMRTWFKVAAATGTKPVFDLMPARVIAAGKKDSKAVAGKSTGRLVAVKMKGASGAQSLFDITPNQKPAKKAKRSAGKLAARAAAVKADAKGARRVAGR